MLRRQHNGHTKRFHASQLLQNDAAALHSFLTLHAYELENAQAERRRSGDSPETGGKPCSAHHLSGQRVLGVSTLNPKPYGAPRRAHMLWMTARSVWLGVTSLSPKPYNTPQRAHMLWMTARSVWLGVRYRWSSLALVSGLVSWLSSQLWMDLRS